MKVITGYQAEQALEQYGNLIFPNEPTAGFIQDEEKETGGLAFIITPNGEMESKEVDSWAEGHLFLVRNFKES